MDFYLDRDPVGAFVCRAYPTAPGTYRYAPYRGQGHARLGQLLDRSRAAECWFLRRGERFVLVVVGKTFVPGSSKSTWTIDVSDVARAGEPPPPPPAPSAGVS